MWISRSEQILIYLVNSWFVGTGFWEGSMDFGLWRESHCLLVSWGGADWNVIAAASWSVHKEALESLHDILLEKEIGAHDVNFHWSRFSETVAHCDINFYWQLKQALSIFNTRQAQYSPRSDHQKHIWNLKLFKPSTTAFQYRKEIS